MAREHIPSFTLTMWDVKPDPPEEEKKGGEFYLNYVGCKEKAQKLFASLTSSFYLNYVGCKGNTVSVFPCRFFSFTLTMWDVKFFFQFTFYFLDFVLP